MATPSTLSEIDLSVSDALALLNQTLEYAYPSIAIVGELSSFRVSKNRWVYFDLKDEFGLLKFFGTVYNLPGPLQDGMLLRVIGMPRIHPLYGFSINVMSIEPVGEGSLKKVYDLLLAKLTAEGLFDPGRKRVLPYPPESVGLITSKGSAAEADFLKITRTRWPLLKIKKYDVHVQGEQTVTDIISALNDFNQQAEPPEVLVITRGGGSAEDLAAFNDERLVRAVAASRIPTLLAIGHEVDLSLAELAADARASTPSNAAELLVPDLKQIKSELASLRQSLSKQLDTQIVHMRDSIKRLAKDLNILLARAIRQERENLAQKRQLAELYDPKSVLKRGYALVRKQGKVVRSIHGLKAKEALGIEFYDGSVDVSVHGINKS